MLGRRKSRSSPESVDIAERVRRRATRSHGGESRTPTDPAARDKRQDAGPDAAAPGSAPAKLLSFSDTPAYRVQETSAVDRDALYQVLSVLTDRLESQGPLGRSRKQVQAQVQELIDEVLADLQLHPNQAEQRQIIVRLVDELIGRGPLEPLLTDETVSDVMVTGADKVYVQRRGRLQLTDVSFRNDDHLLRIARRILRQAGKRVDVRRPMAEARLENGERVHVVIPPLAIDGPTMTIRKFNRKPVGLDQMVRQGNLSEAMATLLKVATRCGLNVLVHGARGSGRTTLLEALAATIDPNERIVTIEDPAELRLSQPNSLRLEPPPADRASDGDITPRDLFRKARQLCADRIILGELRGAEAFDLLQAMTTGCRGSLGVLLADDLGEALGRLETLAGLAGPETAATSARRHIAEAIDLVVHLRRLDDGGRRVTRVTEVLGAEDGGRIVTRDLFTFQVEGMGKDGRLRGSYAAGTPSERFLSRARARGVDEALHGALPPAPGGAGAGQAAPW